MSALLFVGQTVPLIGNPTGGAVVAGSATIEGTGSNTVTVKQNSGTTIINWQNFSIGAGELTKFVQPSSSSRALNRVISGNPSAIYGTLSSNGQIFLINPNGILVGAGGVINTQGFTASTRDIANADFLSGNLHFTGSSSAGVQNLGTINALGGNIYLIGHTVDNQGTINAPLGTVGLAAGDDVTLAQSGAEGLFIQPNANANPNAADAKLTAVSNSGKITAATAQLKAANGNMYALAINNRGSIVATTVKHQGGHIFLTADSGTVVNTGTLDASATAAGGQGGTVTLKSAAGTAIHTGAILAKGGKGGKGGSVDVSGKVVQLGGTVNTTAPGGTTGNFLIDPASLDVVAGGSTSQLNASAVDNGYVSSLLATTSLTLNADNNITVSNAISWTAATTLTLSTNKAGSTVDLNAPISGLNGGLTIDLSAATDVIHPQAAIDVSSFILQSGSWQQAGSATLPFFIARQDFEVNGSSLFIRSIGSGTGIPGAPYQITDIYGLQGMDANDQLPGVNAVLVNDIDASGTSTWNGGAGFVPIGTSANYTGTFDGADFAISGLTVNQPTVSGIGLFGVTGTGSVIKNLSLTGVSITGFGAVGGLVGDNNGTVQNVSVAGSVTGSDNSVGGVVGSNAGTVQMSSASAAVSGSVNVGGLVGASSGAGLVETSSATGTVTATGAGEQVGGLIGGNFGTVQTSYASGQVNGNGAAFVGGLVGLNEGPLTSSYATGQVTGGSGSSSVGGLVGTNATGGSVQTSFATGHVTGSVNVGGLVGENNATIKTSYATGEVNGSAGGTGGLVGINEASGLVEASYSIGAVFGGSNTGGLIGTNAGTVDASYWATDVESNFLLSTFGSNTGTVDGFTSGLSSGAMQQQTSFQPVGTGVPNWDFTNIWTTVGNTTTPLLRALSVTISGTTPGATDAVDLNTSDGFVLTNNAVGGVFSYTVTDNVVNSGLLLTDVTGNLKADTYYITGVIPSAPITGLNLVANKLNVLGNGVASNTALANISQGGGAAGLNYTTSGTSPTISLTTGSGVAMNIGTPYHLDGDLTVSGALTTTFAAALTADAGVTVSATGMSLGGSLTSPGVVTITSTGAVIANGAVNVGAFILENGTWTQIVGQNGLGTLPGFATNEFQLQNSSTFERFAGGDGSSATPFEIADIYGLQGLGSPSQSLLTVNANLIGNINANGTVGWNNGGGFVPIGVTSLNSTDSYQATFNGQGFTIDGLNVDRPTQGFVGLFASTSTNAVVENIVLTNVNMTGGFPVGALVGSNGGTVTNATSSGTLSGSRVGGLLGDNGGLLQTSSSSVNVTGGAAGGLVGVNDATGVISGSSATGAVGLGSGSQNGGLVGLNAGSIMNSFATGAVTGSQAVGGLVGEIDAGGSVQGSHATGAVGGGLEIGGLVGDSSGSVDSSFATGAVSGDGNDYGGLIGNNDTGSVLTNSQASGTVTVGDDGLGAGGLVGSNSGSIQTSYATGTVRGGTQVNDFGGLVGVSQGTVTSSYATGGVFVGDGGNGIGGLVGQDATAGQVTTSYATGAVAAGANSLSVGGLNGLEAGVTRSSYSAGAVTAGAGSTGVGGFVGFNEGSVITSVWDKDTAEQLNGIGNQPGDALLSITGVTTAQLQSQVFLENKGFAGFPGTWTTLGDTSTPQLIGLPTTPNPGFNFLSGTAFSDSGTTVDLIGIPIDLYFNGTLFGATTTSSGGGFTFTVPTADLTQGVLLADTSNHGGNTYYQANAPAGILSGLDIWGDTIRVQADSASNAALAIVAGGQTAGVDYGANGGDVTSNNNGFLILSNYTLDGNISGTFINTAAASTVNGNQSVALSAGTMNLAGTLNTTGTVTVNASGAMVVSGDVLVGGFVQQGGTWTQIVGQDGLTALPKFKDSGDFEIQGGTFERFAGGDGSSANPFQINDIHGLQGIGSPSGSLLGDSFKLVQNIKGEATASWNNGAGFVPIGNDSAPFIGTFNGQDNTISGLVVNDPGAVFVGLFGEAASGALLENVNLTNFQVTGNNNTGALAGYNGFGATIDNVSSEGTITGGTGSGSYNIGGLTGANDGTIDNSFSAGTVTGGSGISHVGGLAGGNGGSISNSSSSIALNISGGVYIGGLTGSNEAAATITGSSATGSVSAGSFVGGLVGDNLGALSTSHALGAVSGTTDVGGLVGIDDGTGSVTTSFALGAVTAGGGSTNVGGLVGYNNTSASILSSYATGSVGGTSEVGGLVGLNGGTITLSYANGPVTGSSGSNGVGGLVGNNGSPGRVQSSYATGTVAGTNNVGGFTGSNGGLIETSFATGQVNGDGSSNGVGGLVGQNFSGGTVENSYAQGFVFGDTIVGGLIGANGGTETTSYSLGLVTGNSLTGGLIGDNSGSVAASYWAQDIDSNNNDNNTFGLNSGSVDGATSGEFSSDLTQQSTFLPAGTGSGQWDFTNIWTTLGDTTTPLLKALVVTLSGTTPGANDDVVLTSQGAEIGSTSSSGGAFSFTVPANVLTSGALIVDNSGTFTDTYYVAGAIPTAPITGVELDGYTLNVDGTGVASNTALGNAVASFAGSPNFNESGGNLTTFSGVDMNIATAYQLDGALTANGVLTTTANGTLAGTANVTVTANAMALSGTIADSGVVTLSSSGTISDSGAVHVGGFILANGDWSQIVGQNGLTSLPAFTATSDFELQGSSTFERFAGGTGTSANPFLVTDVYGLQGIGSPSQALLNNNFNLVNDIAASGTTSWNGGAGFLSIGGETDTSSASLGGTFNGQGFAIDGLSMNRPTQTYGGLFAGLAGGSLVENLSLTNVSINADESVGAVTGFNVGSIDNVSVSGAIQGAGSGTTLGGLVGFNLGTISNSSSSASVSQGSNFLGGLVGSNGGAISNSYSTGAVNGSQDVGGLVGQNSGGTITTSFSTGAVSGDIFVGGLSGRNDSGTISDVYSTGSVTGSSGSAFVGGLVGSNETTITNAYTTGTVSVGGGSIDTGGLIGRNDGTVASSFWDVESAGVPLGVGSDTTNTTAGVNAATTAELQTRDFFATYAPGWDFATTWSTHGDTLAPQLRGLPTTAMPIVSLQSLSGTTFLADGSTTTSGAVVNLVYNGSVLASTTADSSGNYTFNVVPTELTNGVVLTNVADIANTYYQVNNPPSIATGINLQAGTLVVKADTVSNTALGNAIGLLVQNGSPLINYSSVSANLTTNSGVNLFITDNFAQDGLDSAYTLDGDITASGSLVTDQASTLTSTLGTVTLTGATMGLNGVITTTGTLNLTTTVGTLDGFNATIIASNATVNSASDFDLQETVGLIAFGGSVPVPSGTGFIDIANGSTINAVASTVTASGPLFIVNTTYTLNGGSLNATGNGFLNTSISDQTDGIDVFGSTINGQGGAITLTGTAGYSNDGIDNLTAGIGLNIGNASTLETSGTINLSGTFDQPISSTGAIIGFSMNGVGTSVRTTNGQIIINGTVSQGGAAQGFTSGGDVAGVLIGGGAVVQATGDGGTISITGDATGSTAYDSPTSGGDDDGILINGNASPNTILSVATNGSLTLNGTGGTIDSTFATSFNAVGQARGIEIATATQITSGTGSAISLTGNGGAAVTNDGDESPFESDFSGYAEGVDIGDNTNHGGIAQITAADGGSITITGNGGSLDVSNDIAPGNQQTPDVHGIVISHGSTVTANGSATITLVGTGGNVTAGTNRFGDSTGVSIHGEASGENTMISSGSGLITIDGNGGVTPNGGNGVTINGFDGGTATVESDTGNISINGSGGPGYTGTGSVAFLPGGATYIPNAGVILVDAATLQTGGAGTISVIGSGGDANSPGVDVVELTGFPTIDPAPVLPTINSAGLLSLTSMAGTDVDLNGTVSAPAVTLSSERNIMIAGTPLNLIGALTVSANGTILDSSLVNVGSFLLQGGTWTQIVGQSGLGALPAFAASDFELPGGTFERFAGIDAANGNADEITDIYGLQGLGSSGLLSANAELINNIDATSVTTWNGGAGFVPIGRDPFVSGAVAFTGTFNGQHFVINGLYENPSMTYDGLFGATGPGSVLENTGLTNIQINAGADEGGLDGANGYFLLSGYVSGGLITDCYVTGAVNSISRDSVGGLVGFNNGTIRDDYSSASVTDSAGSSYVGGLVGYNNGTISNVYNTGPVTGYSSVGGLVGQNNAGTINDAYAAGPVTGNINAGGLVGTNGGSISNSFWTTDTAGVTLGIGSDPTNTTPGVTATTTGQLISQNFILAHAIAAPTFDFTPGTGVWGSDGVMGTSGGTVQVNNGLPYFQWQFPTPVEVVANDQTIGYGGSINSGAFSVVPGSATLGNFVTGPVSVTSALPSTTGVGTYTGALSFGNSVQPNLDVTIEQVIGDQTISPAAVTITANDANKTYGNTVTFAGTEFSSSPLPNGETIGSVTLASTGATAFAVVAGSPYDIVPSNATGGTFNPANYSITYVSGQLTVNPARLTITTTNGTSTYGTVPNVSGNFSDTSIVGDPNPVYSTAPNVTTTATQFSTVASGPYPITASGEVAPNYSITYVNTGSLTINPASLVITTTNATSTYGSPVPDLRGNFTDTAIPGDPNPIYSTAPNVTTTATQFSPLAGSPYPISASGAVAPNYTITYSNTGALSLNQASLTVIADDQNKTYGGVDPTLTYTVTGLLGSDQPSVVSGVGLNTVTGAAATAGTHPITAIGGTAQNYTITDANGTLSVTPAQLTVTANDDNQTYSATPYSGDTQGVSYAGFQYTDSAASLPGTLTYTGTSQGAVNVGTYGTTPGGYTVGNYTYVYASGQLAITPAALTVTANDANVTYNGNAFSGGNGATYAGFKGSDDATSLGGALTYSGTSQGAVDAGTYSITPGGYTSSNYAISYTDGQLAITPASLTITALPDGKTYDTNAYNGGNGVNFSGFQGEDSSESLSGQLAYSGSAQGAVNAGTYAITPGGLTSPNYNINYVDGQLTVAPAPLTIAGVMALDKPFDGFTTANLDLSQISLFGALGEDDVQVDPNTYAANFASPNVGSQIPVIVSSIGLTGGSAGNYVVIPPAGLVADITPSANGTGGLPVPPPPPIPVPPPVTPITPITMTIVPPPVLLPPPGTGTTQGDLSNIPSLVTSSSTSSDVRSGDVAQINDGGVNNATNPVANATIHDALSPAVQGTLEDALAAYGSLTDFNTVDTSNDTAAADTNGGETILTAGDVVAVADNQVKGIPLSEAPKPLQDALGNLVMNGLQSGSGKGH